MWNQEMSCQHHSSHWHYRSRPLQAHGTSHGMRRVRHLSVLLVFLDRVLGRVVLQQRLHLCEQQRLCSLSVGQLPRLFRAARLRAMLQGQGPRQAPLQHLRNTNTQTQINTPPRAWKQGRNRSNGGPAGYALSGRPPHAIQLRLPRNRAAMNVIRGLQVCNKAEGWHTAARQSTWLRLRSSATSFAFAAAFRRAATSAASSSNNASPSSLSSGNCRYTQNPS